MHTHACARSLFHSRFLFNFFFKGFEPSSVLRIRNDALALCAGKA